MLLMPQHLHLADLYNSPVVSHSHGVVETEVDESELGTATLLASVADLEQEGGEKDNAPLLESDDVVEEEASKTNTREASLLAKPRIEAPSNRREGSSMGSYGGEGFPSLRLGLINL